MQDPDRFLALLAPHRTQMLVICRSLLRRKADADDALQEALLQSWRDFPRFREGASFRAWLMKYLVNIIRNRNRLLREELDVPLPVELADPQTLLDWESAYEHFFREPERILGTIDEDLARAILALSAAERLVLLLRCVADLSYREISEVLGMPEGTAMSHLSRARKHSPIGQTTPGPAPRREERAMKCHEARQLFFLYHDSELEPRSAEAVNLHLEACPACRDVWTRERWVEDAISRAAWTSAGPVEDFSWNDLQARVQSRRRPRRPARRWIAAAVVLLGSLAVVFALIELNRSRPTVATALRSAVEHHEKYMAGKSPVQVRGPDAATVRNFYAGELGFEVLVPEGRSVEEAEGRPAVLVGARRCTFLGGPVAYVTYRIGGKDVTAIVGPLMAPESVLEAISQSTEGCIEQEVQGCRVLVATVRGILFVAAGATEPETLRRLAETFQARGDGGQIER